MASTPPIRLGSAGRLEALSDGVFAIAITLLVLEVKVPELEDGERLRSALWHLWPSYAAYAVSFATIGIMWVNHHSIFERVRGTDRALTYRNLFLLGCVSFLPFPTAVLARYLRDDDDAGAAAVAYGLTMVLIGLSFALLWDHLVRHPTLLADGVSVTSARRARLRSSVGPAVYVVATVVAAIAPIAALAIYGAIALYFALTRHPDAPANSDGEVEITAAD